MTDANSLGIQDDRIGRSLDELDTPSLLLDRAASDRNLRRMADFFRSRSAKLRPHFKNHKCVTLAKRQLEAGSAVGITCAKLGEAEVLVENGITDVLIANQVVGSGKLGRLAELNRQAKVMVAIDHLDHAKAISQAAMKSGVTIPVLIEVDIGMGRCGVDPGKAAFDLARELEHFPGIHLAGIQAYEGHLVNVLDRNERNNRVRAAMDLAVSTRKLMESSGISIERISGCSSATYDCSGVLDGVDEVQAGSYATMDRQYQRLAPEFEIALSVLVRVISRPTSNRAVLDLGVKGAGAEFGVPCIRDYPEVEIPIFMAEEHTVVQKAPDWKIGQTLHLIPSHACTTCNLHRELIVHENNVVVDIWPIEASGRLK